jgi:hypothetical protein
LNPAWPRIDPWQFEPAQPNLVKMGTISFTKLSFGFSLVAADKEHPQASTNAAVHAGIAHRPKKFTAAPPVIPVSR